MYSCGLCAISFRRKDNLGRHIRNAHPDKKAEIIKNFSKLPKFVMKPVVDNPNAIKVITASPIAKKDENNKVVSTSRICINGPLKLALKTSAFKRNYNINRDCILESNSRGDILHVSSSKTHKNHYRDVEKPHDSLQTEQTPSPRIFPSVYSTPNLSADEFYANRPYVIKNIKFKIPDNYPFRNESLLKAIIPQIQSRARGDECTEESGSHGMSMVNKSNSLEVSNNNDHTGLRHNLKNVSVVATSVIVNSSNQKNIHWRRRMSQNIVSEKI
ncbi:hypothetical protein HHI36_016969 [Cryptolaemus montrouzieri]|uniref:C2H2-type domain-containing protein n=1 Tax=Cryptolaemus montrouzieri TaxID=559131 RepID=A0ABD2NLB0_9CUCU